MGYRSRIRGTKLSCPVVWETWARTEVLDIAGMHSSFQRTNSKQEESRVRFKDLALPMLD